MFTRDRFISDRIGLLFTRERINRIRLIPISRVNRTSIRFEMKTVPRKQGLCLKQDFQMHYRECEKISDFQLPLP